LNAFVYLTSSWSIPTTVTLTAGPSSTSNAAGTVSSKSVNDVKTIVGGTVGGAVAIVTIITIAFVYVKRQKYRWTSRLDHPENHAIELLKPPDSSMEITETNRSVAQPNTEPVTSPVGSPANKEQTVFDSGRLIHDDGINA
jgi:hypothetical protein